MATKNRSAPLRWQASKGYSKSSETRRAILRAAIVAFGRAGFTSASTRQIATDAGVNQPAISYYFGSKDALYRACAEEIMAAFSGPLIDVSVAAHNALRSELDPQAAAQHLNDILSALADVMIMSEQVSEAADFIQREMRNPGPAYQYLYDNLWAPGVELAAQLVAAVKGRTELCPADRVDTIIMISGIAAFVPGQSVSMEVMQWRVAGESGKALVLDRLRVQIDGWMGS